MAAPQRLARGRGAMTVGLGEISRAQLFGGRNTAAGGGLPGVRTADEIKAAYGRATTRRRARRAARPRESLEPLGAALNAAAASEQARPLRVPGA